MKRRNYNKQKDDDNDYDDDEYVLKGSLSYDSRLLR